MSQKLFQIIVVLVVAIVSMAFIAFLLTGIASWYESPLAGGSYGIVISVGGLSAIRFRFLLVAVVLVAAGCYFFWRRRRSRQ